MNKDEGLIDDQAEFEADDLEDPGLEADEDIDGDVDAEGGAALGKRTA